LQAARHTLKKELKANMKKLSPLDPLVRDAVREVVSKTDGSATLTTKEMKTTVEKAVREAVRERVQEMLSESSEQ
jgi:flagellar basal body-associated protein FliL